MRFFKEQTIEQRYRTIRKAKSKLYADTQYPIEAALDKFDILRKNDKLREDMRRLGIKLYKEFKDEHADDREDREWSLTKEHSALIKYLEEEFQKELRILHGE